MPLLPGGAFERGKPANLRDAACQFEALLLAHMLKTAREAERDSSSDAASASLFEIAEQQLAGMLALRGGLGLARLVEQAHDPERRS
ncbi:MAG: hypothetical protein HY013_06175 [Candidatus Solibacter usitatus]|nr:hypothetical protein [Candidatus Solibacter usitatus]